MAKIRIYKLKGEIARGEKIESISRFDDKAKENLLIKKRKLLKEQGSTLIKSKDVLISSQSTENERTAENNF